MKDSTVLFIDDQIEILNLLKRILRNEPYHQIYASTTDEALEVLRHESVDVVVTDVMMPGTNGFELIDMIAREHPNVVRIILSGFSHMPTILAALNHGKIYRYITKPWKLDEESKRIISEAIDYSKLLKNSKTLETTLHIDYDQLEQFLKSAVVVYKDKCIYTSRDNLDETYLERSLYRPIELSEDVKLFIPLNYGSEDL